MKYLNAFTILALIVSAIAVFRSAYVSVHYRAEIAQLEIKATKFDEVCGLVKSALLVDRRRLAIPERRDDMLQDFAGNTIGDGFAMLAWCVPDAKARVSQVRQCLNDFACVDHALRAMEAAIP